MTANWIAYLVGPAVTMACAIRMGARWSHCWIAVTWPSVLMTGALVAQWFGRSDIGVWQNRFNEVVTAVSILGISSLFARIAASVDMSIPRSRLALILVTAAIGVTTASVSPIPGASPYVMAVGTLIGGCLIAAALPWLARREQAAA